MLVKARTVATEIHIFGYIAFALSIHLLVEDATFVRLVFFMLLSQRIT
jgi:hypothetical protein